MNNYFDKETVNFEKTETKGINVNMNEQYDFKEKGGELNMCCAPIEECPQERVCHRYINYEVPHIIPCHTRIINHHIYRHTFTPCYTCCEENVCENVFGPRC